MASLRAARSIGALQPGTHRRARCPAWLRFLQWLVMRPWGELMPNYQHESELAALTDPALRNALAASDVNRLEGYSDLSVPTHIGATTHL